MIYFLIYVWLGIVVAGFYHSSIMRYRMPHATIKDYLLVILFWPIPTFIAIFSIIKWILFGREA